MKAVTELSHLAGLTWIDCCLEQMQEESQRQPLHSILSAFAGPFPRGGPPPPPEMPWNGSFEGLRREIAKAFDAPALLSALRAEVDQAQAELFLRRLESVHTLLESLCTKDYSEQLCRHARALQVGLRHRATQIGASSTPKALRIRALADFYYSQAALLVHAPECENAPSIEAIMQGLNFRTISPGIEHAHYEGICSFGPLHFNALRIDPALVNIRASNSEEHRAQALSFAQWAGPHCDAAVSGGFFLYSESDIVAPSKRRDPVGLLVCDSEVHNPPSFSRAALVLDAQGKLDIRRVAPTEGQWRDGKHVLDIHATVNRASAKQGPDAMSAAVVGQQVIEVGRALAVPLNGAVLVSPDAARLKAGQRIQWCSPWSQAMAGGPMLLQEGKPCLDLKREDFWGSAPPVTFSQDETGDTNLLARLALGICPDQTFYALAVDGRNFDRALGMTLRGMGKMMRALGCDRAANMDGGSSKRMLVQGQTVDLPSTEVISGPSTLSRVRPVHSALLFSSKSRA